MEVEESPHADFNPGLALHVVPFSLLWAFIAACLAFCLCAHPSTTYLEGKNRFEQQRKICKL